MIRLLTTLLIVLVAIPNIANPISASAGPANMLASASVIGRNVFALAQDEPAPLDGRVGGTEASWITAYGEPLPVTGPVVLTTDFEVEGFSGVLVSIDEGRATGAHLFAPRPEGEEWSSDETGHPMNWTQQEAVEIAIDFLPRDVVLLGSIEERSGSLTQNCESASLLAEVPTSLYDFVDNTPVYGGCSYWLDLDDDGNVTAILVELEIEEPLS